MRVRRNRRRGARTLDAQGTGSLGTRSRSMKSSSRRRQRARTHLARMTRGRSRIQLAQPSRLQPAGAAWKLVLGAMVFACFTVGLLGARPLTEAFLTWWRESPPRLERIAFLGHESLAVPDLAATSGLAKGAPLPGIDPGSVAQKLTAHAWIADAQVALLPNGTAVLGIRERVPVAILSTKDDPKGQLVDAAGVAFTSARPQDTAEGALLRLHSDHAVPEPLLARAVELARAVAALGLPRLDAALIKIPDEPQPGTLDGEDGGWVVRSADGELEVLLGWDRHPQDPQRPMSQSLGRLEHVLIASLFNDPARGRIDLRFKDQAVLRGSLLPPKDGSAEHSSSRKGTGETWREGADALHRPQAKCAHHATLPGGKNPCEETT